MMPFITPCTKIYIICLLCWQLQCYQSVLNNTRLFSWIMVSFLRCNIMPWFFTFLRTDENDAEYYSILLYSYTFVNNGLNSKSTGHTRHVFQMTEHCSSCCHVILNGWYKTKLLKIFKWSFWPGRVKIQ